jgi:hypothetical protein
VILPAKMHVDGAAMLPVRMLDVRYHKSYLLVCKPPISKDRTVERFKTRLGSGSSRPSGR